MRQDRVFDNMLCAINKIDQAGCQARSQKEIFSYSDNLMGVICTGCKSKPGKSAFHPAANSSKISSVSECI